MGATAKGLLLSVAAILAGMYLFYVVAANMALATGLIATLVGDGRSRALEYERPRTFWPGRVQLETVRLRDRDRNVEWQVEVKHADLTIALGPLLHREVRIERLRGDRVRFRLRPRLHGPVNERRALAFPPIAGFEEAPIAPIGPPTPPLSDAEYRLWTVRVDGVNVGVEQIWMDMFRFDGAARARGTFLLKPQRWARVSSPREPPARLDIENGGVTVGGRPMLDDLRGFVDCVVIGFDPREVRGAGVFRFISASSSLHGRLRGLSWSDMFMPRELSGSGEDGSWELTARMIEGRLDPSSVLTAGLPSAELRGGRVRVGGAPDLRIFIDSSRGRPLVRSALALRGAAIAAARPVALTVRVPEVLAIADIDASDLARDKPFISASLRAVHGQLRSARLFGLTAAGSIATEIGLEAIRAAPASSAPSDGSAARDRGSEAPGDLAITGSWLALSSVVVRDNGKSLEQQWWARVEVARGTLRIDPEFRLRARLEGLFRNARPAFAALANEGKLRPWIRDVVRTGKVNGTASIGWDPRRFEICPFRFISSMLTMRGFSERTAHETNGLVVLNVGPLPFKFRIGRGDTSRARRCGF